MNVKKKRADHTFVIPAYGDSPFIEECILSLLEQTVESRLMISTSTPSFFIKDISEKYNIPLIINRNEGIAKDWSFAYNICETQYLTLAHQDDVYYPDYVENSIDTAEQARKVLITFSDYNEIVDGKDRPPNINLKIKRIILFLNFLFGNSISLNGIKRALLLFGSPICCPSVMYNKEVLREFRFSENFKINLDWDAWLRLAQRDGSFVYIKKRLMGHRIYTGSATTAGIKNNLRQKEDRIIFDRLWIRPFSVILTKLYSLSYKANV